MNFKQGDIVQATYNNGDKWIYKVLDKIGIKKYRVICLHCPYERWLGKEMNEIFYPVLCAELLNNPKGHKLTKIFI